MKALWVLLDFDNLPIRYFTWAYPGTIKVKPPKFNFDDYEECLL